MSSNGFLWIDSSVLHEMADKIVLSIEERRSALRKRKIDEEIAAAAKSRFFGLIEGDIISREEAEQKIKDNHMFGREWLNLYYSDFKIAKELLTAIDSSSSKKILVNISFFTVFDSYFGDN